MSFTPELGQYGFSNTPRQEHKTPGHVTHGFEVIAEAIGTKRGDWKRGNGDLTSNNGAEEYVSDTFSMRTYCWCDGERDGHEDGCPPNFEHPASGIKATWYKHGRRSPSINRPVTATEWGRVEADCLASLGIDRADLDRRRDEEVAKCDRCGKTRDRFDGDDMESVRMFGECWRCERKSWTEFCTEMGEG